MTDNPFKPGVAVWIAGRDIGRGYKTVVAKVYKNGNFTTERTPTQQWRVWLSTFGNTAHRTGRDNSWHRETAYIYDDVVERIAEATRVAREHDGFYTMRDTVSKLNFDRLSEEQRARIPELAKLVKEIVG